MTSWAKSAFGRLSYLNQPQAFASNNRNLHFSLEVRCTSEAVDLDAAKGYVSRLRPHEWRNWQTHRI